MKLMQNLMMVIGLLLSKMMVLLRLLKTLIQKDRRPFTVGVLYMIRIVINGKISIGLKEKIQEE